MSSRSFRYELPCNGDEIMVEFSTGLWTAAKFHHDSIGGLLEEGNGRCTGVKDNAQLKWKPICTSQSESEG